jgi:hypothetical protein
MADRQACPWPIRVSLDKHILAITIIKTEVYTDASGQLSVTAT